MKPTLRRRGGRLTLLGVITAGILLLTSFPTADALGRCLGQVICGEHGLADLFTNIMLFFPLGWALRLCTTSRRVLFLVPPFFSLAIEIMQVWIPGRHPNTGDVLFNTAGGWLGAFIAIPFAHLIVARRGSDRAALLWTLGLTLILGATGGLLQAKFPRDSIYFGQWTPTLGGMAPYTGGEVLSATIDTASMPSFGLSNTRFIHAGLELGYPVSVRFVVAPEPDRLAPIFAIADRDQVGVLLFGTLPGRLVVTVRTYADAARLRAPNHEIPLPAALTTVGDTVTVAFHWHQPAGRVMFSVNGVEVGTSEWTLARGWALLYHNAGWPPFIKRSLDFVSMLAMFLPLGYFARPSGLYAVCLVGAVAAVLGIAAAAGLGGMSIAAWLAAAAGLGLGMLARLLPVGPTATRDPRPAGATVPNTSPPPGAK